MINYFYSSFSHVALFNFVFPLFANKINFYPTNINSDYKNEVM